MGHLLTAHRFGEKLLAGDNSGGRRPVFFAQFLLRSFIIPRMWFFKKWPFDKLRVNYGHELAGFNLSRL
jgi:hypothetical protein